MRRLAILAAAALLALAPLGARAEVEEVRIPVGAGGMGFLPLLVMEKQGLVEKHARTVGLDRLKVSWISFGGPSVVNDALLSGASHFARPDRPPSSPCGAARAGRRRSWARPR